MSDPGPSSPATSGVHARHTPPAEVFLSYANEDRDLASQIVSWLDVDYNVFWDREVPPGSSWREVLGKALTAAECVVVLWSRHSVQSQWVLEEAQHAQDRRILVPAMLDDASPPLGFGGVQASDLRDWDGQPDHPQFRLLLEAILGKIRPGHAPSDPTTPGIVARFRGLLQPRSRDALRLARLSLMINLLALLWLARRSWFNLTPLPSFLTNVTTLLTIALILTPFLAPAAISFLRRGARHGSWDLLLFWNSQRNRIRRFPAALSVLLVPLVLSAHLAVPPPLRITHLEGPIQPAPDMAGGIFVPHPNRAGDAYREVPCRHYLLTTYIGHLNHLADTAALALSIRDYGQPQFARLYSPDLDTLDDDAALHRPRNEDHRVLIANYSNRLMGRLRFYFNFQYWNEQLPPDTATLYAYFTTYGDTVALRTPVDPCL